VAGGRKPAQPSIPEGILDFPPPDLSFYRTLQTKGKALKANAVILRPHEKIPGCQQKFRRNKMGYIDRFRTFPLGLRDAPTFS
jgi:hypothetical protein